MSVTEIGDPRLQALFGANDRRDVGVRPTVRLPGKGIPPMAFMVAMVVLAAILFVALNARRTRQEESSVRGAAETARTSWEAPPLYIPPAGTPQSYPAPLAEPAPQVAVVPPPPTWQKSAVRQPVFTPQPLPQVAPPLPQGPPQGVSSGAPLVIDTGGSAGAPAQGAGASPLVSPGRAVIRMRASALANRSMTVPEGYLIPAVLETGLDSTKPGFARAVVARDVRGFDGKNILIPRGSRLIGEYHSEVGRGQKRAIITWTRLIRPDGMTIGLDSPAVDTLGRGGVEGRVDTHFFARFGDALLQSAVGIGQVVATSRLDSPVVVVPGTAPAATTQAMPATNYVPTLTIPAGKSISVFVAHDLDFSAAGIGR